MKKLQLVVESDGQRVGGMVDGRTWAELRVKAAQRLLEMQDQLELFLLQKADQEAAAAKPAE